MYTLKQSPEDFIVREVRDLKVLPEGEHAIYELKKKNYSTVQAVQRLATKLQKPLKDFGFAGNKDRKAVTAQYISIRNPPENIEKLHFKDINLTFKGFKKKRISLGDLDGNTFLIRVRNLSREEVRKAEGFTKNPLPIPNLFGPQRFGSYNYEVGKLLLKKQFKDAVSLIIKHQGEYENIVKRYVEKNKGDYVGSLQKIPRYIKSYFVNSFQAVLFNKMVYSLLKDGGIEENMILPLLGFGTDMEDLPKRVQGIVEQLLQEEQITLRDFIIPQFPELSLEGSSRKLFFTPEGFTIKEQEGETMLVQFTLEKSCYATTLLSFVFQDREDALHDSIKRLVRINVPQ